MTNRLCPWCPPDSEVAQTRVVRGARLCLTHAARAEHILASRRAAKPAPYAQQADAAVSLAVATAVAV